MTENGGVGMLGNPYYSRDPLMTAAKLTALKYPTGSGKRKDWKWLFAPIGVMVAGLIAAAVFLPKPAGLPPYDQQLERYFRSEGMNIYHKSTGRDPYGGYTWADGCYWWYMGTSPEHSDSYDLDDAVWCGVYTDEESFEMVASGFSADGSKLSSKSLSGDIRIAINPSPDLRVYRGDHMILYYRGGDPEIYAVLEKQFGEPIADGRLTASQTWMEILSSDD